METIMLKNKEVFFSEQVEIILTSERKNDIFPCGKKYTVTHFRRFICGLQINISIM